MKSHMEYRSQKYFSATGFKPNSSAYNIYIRVCDSCVYDTVFIHNDL